MRVLCLFMGAHYSDSLRACVDNFLVRSVVLTLLFISLISVSLQAAERRDIGLTQQGARIDAFFVEGESANAPLVILVGGLEGVGNSSRAVEREIQRYEGTAKSRRAFRLIAIP